MHLMNRISRLGPLGKSTLALVIYSLVVLGIAAATGIHASFDFGTDKQLHFAGYLEKYNWSLFFLWWLFLAALVHLTWAPFLEAWRDLQQNEMLRDRDGNPATAEQVDRLCQQMGRFRMILLGAAIAISLVITVVDTQNLRDVYQACSPVKTKETETIEPSRRLLLELAPDMSQEVRDIEKARENQINSKKDIAEKYQNSEEGSCETVLSSLRLADNLELDFNIAYLIPDYSKADVEFVAPSYRANRMLNYAVYFQQVAAGVMAVLATLQLALICYLFWRLERAAGLNREGLQLRLDPYSKLREFGLERWNHAWNNVYWVFSLVLLLPLASLYSQTVDGIDPGQVLLRYVVPILVAAPMVATIIARQQRLPDLWPRIRQEQDSGLVELYHKQLLWPLDRNWASKLGIIVSFVMVGYLLGKNLLDLAS